MMATGQEAHVVMVTATTARSMATAMGLDTPSRSKGTSRGMEALRGWLPGVIKTGMTATPLPRTTPPLLLLLLFLPR